jgi:superfamily II DNA/RNA helicase
MGERGQRILAETLVDIPEDDDDLNAEEQENLEETLVDQATASQTIAELEGEIIILKPLEQQAKALVASGQDRKWDELSRILQNEPQMHDAGGRMRKIIIFSEHRDTLNYLQEKIAGVLGSHDPIVVIHGGVHSNDRRKVQALFRSDPDIRVLVATDAAGMKAIGSLPENVNFGIHRQAVPNVLWTAHQVVSEVTGHVHQRTCQDSPRTRL